METVWIIGAGRFGGAAAEKLSGKHPDRLKIVLVDPLEEHLAECSGPGRELVQAGGVEFLHERLSETCFPDWIIPALPVHLAAEWCLKRLEAKGLARTTVPDPVPPRLPNPIFGNNGDLYISFARFRCPPDCPEPPDICTVTGKPRPEPLYARLQSISCPPFVSLTIRSVQLAPGCGGYRPEALIDLMEQAGAAPQGALISTACACHGVMTAVQFSGR